MKASRFRNGDLIIVIVACASVAAYVLSAALIGEAGFPLDDAWIHQTYARNLVETGQWAFVPGQASAGSTAPVYTLLVSIGYFIGLPYLWWTSLLGAVTLAAAGLLNARLAEKLVANVQGIRLWTGLATVIAWHLVWAAGSGMETMLFGTLSLALLWFGWREVHNLPGGVGAARRGLLLGIVGAAATLTRPEAIGLLGILGILLWIVNGGLRWRESLAWTLGALGGWLLGFVPYIMFNLSTGTGILPNTAAAKQAEYAFVLALPYLRRVSSMLMPLLAGGQVMLLPGVVALSLAVVQRSRVNRRQLMLLTPLLWFVALIGLYAARLPVAYQHGRYVIPALPHLILFGAAGTVYLVRAAQRIVWARVLTRSLGLASVLLFGAFFLLGLQQYGRDVQIIQSEMVATSRWVNENIPVDDLLAVHDIGALGYFAPRPVLDLAGLVSPELIPVIRDVDALWQLMEERGVQYLMALPDQIPGQDVQDARLCEVFSTQGAWSPLLGGKNMAVYALAFEGGCLE